jgi:hypothetical protein
MAKYKRPLPPWKCSRCEKMFVPATFQNKICSADCARSTWADAVARVKAQAKAKDE